MKLCSLILLLMINIYPINSTAQITVEVDDINQLLYEISSNKRILLREGNYSITALDTSLVLNKNVHFVKKYDGGKELNISNLHNLELIGVGENKPLVCNENIYSNIIVLKNCSKIKIFNLEFGHYPEKGICIGGVIKLIDCSNIFIDNCLLFGSGSDGIATINTKKLKCSNSIIKECTATVLNLENSSNYKFTKCVFEKNGGSDYYSPYLIPMNNCFDIKFKKCNFIKNITSINPEFETNSSLIYIDGDNSNGIILKKCEISGNAAQYFVAGRADKLKVNRVKFIRNKFIYGKNEAKKEAERE